MPMIVIHLRWGDVLPGLHDRVGELLPGDPRLPPGCRARALRWHGHALLVTEVWSTEGEARQFLRQLAEPMRLLGLGEPSHTAVFAVPDSVAVSCLRAGRGLGQLSFPRDQETDEMLPLIGPPLGGAVDGAS